MLILGPLGFATPWLLAGLVALPVLWLILRAVPPSPRLVDFPAIGLLLGLRDRRAEARRAPWWLLLLRCLAIAALILAFAGPVWKPAPRAAAQDGPLLVVLDAGWAAAPGWPDRQARAARALGDAAAAGRPAALLIADGRSEGAIAFGTGSDFLDALRAARPLGWPSAWPADPAAALAALPGGGLETLWIADGLDGPGRAEFLAALNDRGPVRVIAPAAAVQTLTLAEETAMGVIDAPDATPDAATTEAGDPADPSDSAPLRRGPSLVLNNAAADPAPDVLAIGPDPQGIARPLATLRPTAASGDGTRAVPIDLPPELRNRLTRFEIAGAGHAGAVLLADDRTRRRKVALVGEADRAAEGQILLSPLHYLRRALTPSTDLVEGGLTDVIDAAPDVIVLVDQVDPPETDALAEWVEGGGLLIRFAGPRMATSVRLDADALLPVRLRPGGRDVGGALSWGEPRPVAPFDAEGPFAGLVPPADVTVRAQLMADPGPDLAARTLARLGDGTPLVTRQPRGEGQIVLFHSAANAEWSNLPLSGLFVAMLDRLVASARLPVAAGATAGDADVAAVHWSALTVLDGFGRESPADGIAPVPAADFALGPAPGRPAGLYQAGQRQVALNAGIAPVAADWAGATVEAAGAASPGRDLSGALLLMAALLLALDALGSARVMRGSLRAAATIGALWLAGMAGAPAPAQAQDGGQSAPDIPAETIRAADEVALAYVITGDPEIDEVSRQGLAGLSLMLRARTSVEPGDPVAIDLDRDELSVLSFLYWPVTADQPAPTAMAYLRLNQFLRSGGMILFDTRDGDIAGTGGPDRSAALQRLAAPLDIPPLAPIPGDHVVTRSFYLLDGFPGRWTGAEVWAEAPMDETEVEGLPFRRLNDGVTPVVIGGNSWAEAWAMDARNMAVFPVGSGWEGEAQREMAFRFGINLVVHALTGNYKSDQVHVPALLDRLRVEEVIR